MLGGLGLVTLLSAWGFRASGLVLYVSCLVLGGLGPRVSALCLCFVLGGLGLCVPFSAWGVKLRFRAVCLIFR